MTNPREERTQSRLANVHGTIVGSTSASVHSAAEIVLSATTIVVTLRVGATLMDERSGDGFVALPDPAESLLEIRDEITRLLKSNVEPYEASAIVLPRPVNPGIEDRE